MSDSIKEITGRKAKTYFRSSVADDNIFGFAGYPVLGIGPVGGNAHAPNEWVSISSLKTLYNIIKDFLDRVDGH
jgi:acetylornithine deacetylase/succinyl-diaminopimelate desuccinylase-like protein